MSGERGTPDTGATHYDERYFSATYGHAGLRRLGLHWWSVRWYATMAERCLRRIGGRCVLEIGCGHGFMLARLERKFQTFGVDISEYAIGRAAQFAPRSTCIVADIDQGFPPQLRRASFDLVVAKYVFEHLCNPARSLVETAELLRPGGVLFYSVPYTNSLGAHLKGENWFAHPHSDPTHRSLLPREKWLELTRSAGLAVERESADGWWDVPYVRWLPTWLQLPFVIGPTALACISGRAILPPRWGENVLVFARKPAPAAAV